MILTHTHTQYNNIIITPDKTPPNPVKPATTPPSPPTKHVKKRNSPSEPKVYYFWPATFYFYYLISSSLQTVNNGIYHSRNTVSPRSSNSNVCRPSVICLVFCNVDIGY